MQGHNKSPMVTERDVYINTSKFNIIFTAYIIKENCFDEKLTYEYYQCVYEEEETYTITINENNSIKFCIRIQNIPCIKSIAHNKLKKKNKKETNIPVALLFGFIYA